MQGSKHGVVRMSVGDTSMRQSDVQLVSSTGRHKGF
jgi:hypothetical protein